MEDEHAPLVGATRTKGLSWIFAMLCIVDLFGVFPIVALPRPIIDCGWLGIPLSIFVMSLQMYTAYILGKCWLIAEAVEPTIVNKNRYPYAAIAELCFGVNAARVVTVFLQLTIFGGGIPNLLIAQMNVLIRHLRQDAVVLDDPSIDLVSMTSRLEGKCEKISKIHPLLQNSGSDFKLVNLVLRPELWAIDAPFRVGELSVTKSPSQHSPFDSGTPNEGQSDRCVFDLLEVPRNEVQPRCHVPRECWEWENAGPVPTGYPLTHRLIYLQIARQLGCKYTPIQGERRLCSLILSEARTIVAQGFPVNQRDLFTEQVALCGMSGFLEFLTPDWRSSLLSWQHPEGCFGHQTTFVRSNLVPRSRRSNMFLEGSGCSTHMNGVAAMALAVHLRAMVEATGGGVA